MASLHRETTFLSLAHVSLYAKTDSTLSIPILNFPISLSNKIQHIIHSKLSQILIKQKTTSTSPPPLSPSPAAPPVSGGSPGGGGGRPGLQSENELP